MVCTTSLYLLNDIVTKAGPSVNQASTDIAKQSRKAALETNAGNLKCKKILFQYWTINKESPEALYQSIRDFVSQAVQHAIKHQHTSIAFPAIGCGKINTNKAVVAKEMLFEAQKQLLAANILLQIVFVILPHQQEVLEAFQTQLKLLQKGNVEPNTTQVCYTLTSK